MATTIELQDRQAYRVKEVVKLIGLSRVKVFQLLRDGRLRSIKVDASRLIPASALSEFLEQRTAIAVM